MILDVLIFTLGVLVAGLLALAALPAVWRRALRLSEERLSRLVPLSPEEIAADRDHLRAVHAVELRRMEQRLERAETVCAVSRVEAARRETRILALDDEGARAQVAVASLEAEAAGLRREINGLWAEHGAEAIALHGLSELAEVRLRDIAALQGERGILAAERDRLAQEVDRSRSSVAGLETRLLGADTRNEDLRRELDAARRELDAARRELDAARRELDAARRELDAARRESAAASERLAAEREAAAAAAPRIRPGRMPEDHGHEVDSLRTELAFMAEQAASAERRATEASKALDALKAERAAAADPALPAADHEARLRASLAALAEDVMRFGRAPAAP